MNSTMEPVQIDENDVNIALSGWSGVGTSTLTLNLALLLQREYINLGQVFRDLGQALGKADEGRDRIEVDEYLESTIGETVDLYIEHVLIHDRNLILESDIAAFRIGRHPKLVSFFLTADMAHRLERVKQDERDLGEEMLQMRDEGHQKKYYELWEIDFFDLKQIQDTYVYVIDTSQLSIEQTLDTALELLEKNEQVTGVNWSAVSERKHEVLRLFEQEGKAGLRARLRDQGLLRPSEKIVRDIHQLFPEQVANFPENVRDMFTEKIVPIVA